MTSKSNRATLTPLSFFWFRRDLRLEDNTGLLHALKSGNQVQCIFIFDTNILGKLEKYDRRVIFIHRQLERLNGELARFNSTLITGYGDPPSVWKNWFAEFNIQAIYSNRDYEPYAMERDSKIELLAKKNGALFFSFKDQVIFEKDEVTKSDGSPYTVFTPYKKKYLEIFSNQDIRPHSIKKHSSHFCCSPQKTIHSLSRLGFKNADIEFVPPKIQRTALTHYAQRREFPAIDGTSKLGVHLRFGTISIRKLMRSSMELKSEIFTSELIWRDFFQMILWHFPHVAGRSFKPAYDRIAWRNNENEFAFWCEGNTGFPMVDAGMRELNATGYMHNRVRMVTASFLVKHLLVDWRWGEAYFAKQLLDYDLASNNGNWQWAAGCGCDAAPYFRIFNPLEQSRKFDPGENYVKKWIPEYGTPSYPKPITDHSFARERCLRVFRQALQP